jgi:hypothetical protein
MSETIAQERTQRQPIAKDTPVTIASTGRRMKVWRDMGDLNIICYSYSSYKGNTEFAELHTLDNLIVGR